MITRLSITTLDILSDNYLPIGPILIPVTIIAYNEGFPEHFDHDHTSAGGMLSRRKRASCGDRKTCSIIESRGAYS